MDIGQLTQTQLKEILMDVKKKGEESEDLNAVDLINEIKRQIISALSSIK
ncbi:hypothetical protein [Paenibacillus foliorum]|nr:hypothetical protein [Paenibacillus foliorum]